jgi:signal recognition particle receptor subunit beta/predicted  nucleic acid-binding Zn-ribbon protein
MVIYNAATRELTAKIVYYGPGLCGKTTNLKVLHDRLEPGTAGRLLNLQTQTDRTIYFDLLPVELGDIKGYKIRFQLATVPGQTAFNETRRVVLKGVDGIVFVADSQWTMLPKNLESWQNLKDNLKSNEITFEKIPVVVQYNKRDLADILAVDAMQEALGLSSYPFVEAVASAGRGVTETFKLISKLTFVDLLRRLQGRRAEEAGAVAPSPAPEQARHDDLQTWKDSLLNRESQSVPATPDRASRPFALVPPVSDEAPFDATELGRGVDEDEGPSPFSVPQPPDLAPTAPAEAVGPAETVQMEAFRPEEAEEAEEAPEAPEVLSEAEEVEIEILANQEPVTDPAFLPAEAATADGRIELLEQRLQAAEDRANREREASERLAQALAAVQERIAASSENLSALGERLAAIEKGVGGLHEELGSALQRLAPIENAAGRHQDLEGSLRGLEAGLRDLDERLRSDSTRQRKDSDDVAMALRGLTERAQTIDQQIAAMMERVGGHQNAVSALSVLAERVPQLEGQLSELRELFGKLPQLEAQVEAVLRQHHDIEATLDEKTQQGRREAEDIRSQIAPLLEDRVRRHESDALLFSEMERLRESLADSLHDLAERLRHVVRE